MKNQNPIDWLVQELCSYDESIILNFKREILEAKQRYKDALSEKKEQLTLGEFIEKLEKLELICDVLHEPKNIYFDFGSAIPTELDSYRGYYDQLALGYKLSGYDNAESRFSEIKATDLLNHLKLSVDKMFTGWKGGDYIMGKDTPLWVDNPGSCNSTAIVDVIEDDYGIFIITQHI